MYQVDTYNNFHDDQGNQLHIGELKYVTKYGKEALSFVDNVPSRDWKFALSLVVHLPLEHSNVPEEKSCVVDLLMKDIKKSSKEERIHSNSIEKVNDRIAKFVVDFIAMSWFPNIIRSCHTMEIFLSSKILVAHIKTFPNNFISHNRFGT